MLDCNTTNGRKYIREQASCIQRLESVWNVNIAQTPLTESADIDGVICRNGIVHGVLEIKCRNMGEQTLRRFGSYLVTEEKIAKLARIGTALCVPSVLAVSLLEDGKIAYWRISNPDGSMAIDYTPERTATQATCNGGEAVRVNAYLGLESMKLISPCRALP